MNWIKLSVTYEVIFIEFVAREILACYALKSFIRDSNLFLTLSR
jgi:hypothetical protein